MIRRNETEEPRPPVKYLGIPLPFILGVLLTLAFVGFIFCMSRW